MLIRSQDKETLINFDHSNFIELLPSGKSTHILYVWESCKIGEYSTREKALKVLDMIQKAYAIYKSNEIVNTGLTATAYIGGYDTKESIIHGVKVLKEYAETLEDMIIFQMPDDIEVET